MNVDDLTKEMMSKIDWEKIYQSSFQKDMKTARDMAEFLSLKLVEFENINEPTLGASMFGVAIFFTSQILWIANDVSKDEKLKIIDKAQELVAEYFKGAITNMKDKT